MWAGGTAGAPVGFLRLGLRLSPLYEVQIPNLLSLLSLKEVRVYKCIFSVPF